MQLPTSPNFKGNLTAWYSFPLAGRWEGHAQGGLVYQSFVWSDLRTAQREVIGQQPAYALFDAKVGAQKGGVGIELFIDNAFDRRAENFRYAECNPLLCGQQTIYHNIFPPRTVGVKLTQKF